MHSSGGWAFNTVREFRNLVLPSYWITKLYIWRLTFISNNSQYLQSVWTCHSSTSWKRLEAIGILRYINMWHYYIRLMIFFFFFCWIFKNYVTNNYSCQLVISLISIFRSSCFENSTFLRYIRVNVYVMKFMERKEKLRQNYIWTGYMLDLTFSFTCLSYIGSFQLPAIAAGVAVGLVVVIVTIILLVIFKRYVLRWVSYRLISFQMSNWPGECTSIRIRQSSRKPFILFNLKKYMKSPHIIFQY